MASEGIDLKLEEAFCLFLLGQVFFSLFSTNCTPNFLRGGKTGKSMYFLVSVEMCWVINLKPFQI